MTANTYNLPSVYTVLSNHTISEVWINNETKQHSLHAAVAFKKEAVITPFSAQAVFTSASYLTIQTGINQHITLLPQWLQYTNHSCDPNVFFDTSSMLFIALKDIEPGDELRFFYPGTEWEMSQPFQCNCGSSNCLGQISGAKDLPSAKLGQYRLSDFITSMLNQ